MLVVAFVSFSLLPINALINLPANISIKLFCIKGCIKNGALNSAEKFTKHPASFFVTFHEASKELKGPFSCFIVSSDEDFIFLDSFG